MRAEDAVKDFWATRPRRPRRGRKIAGVAAGIANRYRIDPVLVRVGLVVAAIYGGAGILVYLLGWLFLPEEDDQVSPVEALVGKGRSSTSSGFTVLLCLILIPVSGWFFGGAPMGTFPAWMSLLVIGGLLYLLHQSRGALGPAPRRPATEPVTPPATTPVAYEVPLPPPGTPVAAPPPVDDRTTPPAWDPLGAAPFAWDLPEPAVPEPEEPEPPVKRRKSRIGTATVGIALVAAAGMSFVMGGWITPQHIVGVVLAVLGLGMVAGAFLRGGRGLIALAVPLSVAGLALTMVDPDGYHGVGNLEARPVSVPAVRSEYVRSVGDVTVDLTRLPDTGSVETEVRTDFAGDAEVILPANADVVLRCQADTGNVDCLGEQRDGVDPEVELRDDGADGPGGLQIELTVSTAAGNVEVRRG
jgi:phage shock protein PspC (stress-responsive transcriptional regulator)